MASYYAPPPRSSSSSRERATHAASTSNGSNASAAPQYELQAYPHPTSHSHGGVALRDQPYGLHETSPLARNDPLSTNLHRNDPGHGIRSVGAEEERLSLDQAYDMGYPPMRSETVSTHDSRSGLTTTPHAAANVPSGGGFSAGANKSGTTTPIHPGASVQMRQQDSGSSLPRDREKRFGEKSGYRSPRARSHDRTGSQAVAGAGLGNWSGPAGLGASPYGSLGGGENSGLQSAASSNPNLVYADGDFIKPPSNAFTRAVTAIYDSSFIVRWIIYIIPVLGLLWIPGIVGLTAAPDARIWEVPLVWWSAWLSIVWCGWWGAAIVGRLGPRVLHYTIGVIAPESRHYITYLKAIQFYVGAALWAMSNWISFLPFIRNHATSERSNATLSLLTQGLFGIFLVLMILLAEKLVIQVIAHNFHKKSYEDRIVEQKNQISALVALYVNTRDLGRSDTLDNAAAGRPKNRRQGSDPTLLVKSALKGVKKVAQTATTVIGTVASEIAGEQVLKPTSAQSMVLSALGSANKSKQLARRIYYSFCPSYRDSFLIEDISRCFHNREQAEKAFAIFDRDGNGDATRDEIEMAVLDVHRERLALSRSMRDIDSAVGRLDSIIMSVWYVVSILILAGLLNASFNTMITSAGTLILGLSWLIGTTAQEILASIILLFVKHPYDVGDRVDIDGVSYVVLEMHLLSTVFRNVNGTVTQAPHSIINTKFLQNIRRSGAIWETFTWDVDFSTPFEKIEALRSRMMEFVEAESRDFLPSVDITIKDFEAQGKMTLSTNINYRGNWQNGALKAQRRNKFLCAMKLAMADLKIYGPAGAGDPAPPPPDPTPVMMVPYVEPKKDDDAQDKDKAKTTATNLASKVGDIASDLTSRRAVIDAEGKEFDTRERGDIRGEVRK